MEYDLAIYPPREVPQVGDWFEVIKIDTDVQDMYWGKCTVVRLRLVRRADVVTLADPAQAAPKGCEALKGE